MLVERLTFLVVAGFAVYDPVASCIGHLPNNDGLVDVSRISLDVCGKLAAHFFNRVDGKTFWLRTNWEQIKLPKYRIRSHSRSASHVSGEFRAIVFLIGRDLTVDRNEDNPDKCWSSTLEADNCYIAWDELLEGPPGAPTSLGENTLEPTREDVGYFVREINNRGRFDRFQFAPYIKSVRWCSRTAYHSSIRNNKWPKTANLASIRGRFISCLVNKGATPIGSNIYRIAAQSNKNDAGAAGSKSKKHPNGQPKYLRFNPGRWGPTQSRDQDGRRFVHLEDQDVDVSWDMQHWYHLFGSECTFHLPSLEVK